MPIILIVATLFIGCAHDVGINDKECYTAKRINVSCSSYTYLQIFGLEKIGISWTHDNIRYDNVIAVTNYVDTIKADIIYVVIAKSRDAENCLIPRPCPTYIVIEPFPGPMYCLENVSPVKCPAIGNI